MAAVHCTETQDRETEQTQERKKTNNELGFTRRKTTFIEQLTHPDSCLTHLIPPRRDLSIYLRRTRLYELLKTRTVLYAKSFLP